MSQDVWGWILVVGGTILVGLGGLIATLGWNKITAADQRRNAIAGIAREVRLNDRLIKEAVQLIERWPQRSENEGFSPETYRSSHVAGALTSGLLQPEFKDDQKLLQTLEDYEAAISRFNAALRIVGLLTPGIFIKHGLIHADADAKGWPTNYRDAFAPPFEALVTYHDRTLAVLQGQYPWALDKTGSGAKPLT
jgi:hypothetical protein